MLSIFNLNESLNSTEKWVTVSDRMMHRYNETSLKTSFLLYYLIEKNKNYRSFLSSLFSTRMLHEIYQCLIKNFINILCIDIQLNRNLRCTQTMIATMENNNNKKIIIL